MRITIGEIHTAFSGTKDRLKRLVQEHRRLSDTGTCISARKRDKLWRTPVVVFFNILAKEVGHRREEGNVSDNRARVFLLEFPTPKTWQAVHLEYS